jgi:predicted nucleotidyltransferase
MKFDELKARREAILAIAERYGARDLRVFGSVVRDQADASSDIDFLVELEGTPVRPWRIADGPAGASTLQGRRDDAGHVEAAHPGTGSA